MNVTLIPGPRTGRVKVPASKSQAHRLMILAALGTSETKILCEGISQDIEATMSCLSALGAEISVCADEGFLVRPISAFGNRAYSNADTGSAYASEELRLDIDAPDSCRIQHLFCGESGSTLRFLLPLSGAFMANVVFHMEGRLPERPLAPLDSELMKHGMTIQRENELLYCSGQLMPGDFTLPGNISSQYISGLLMALPLLSSGSRLFITEKIESEGYLTITEDALRLSGIQFKKKENFYEIPGGQRSALPSVCRVEGDYSSAAFFLCAGALSKNGVCVEGLNPHSSQGDRRVIEVLKRFGAEIKEEEDFISVRRKTLKGCVIDASQVPDLIPVLSVVAAVAEGESRIIHAGRLRIKESDRLASTAEMLTTLGADVTEEEEGLRILGKPFLRGGALVDPYRDHRIAMAASVAAMVSERPVVIKDSECVKKSYPNFFRDFENLEGPEDRKGEMV